MDMYGPLVPKEHTFRHDHRYKHYL